MLIKSHLPVKVWDGTRWVPYDPEEEWEKRMKLTFKLLAITLIVCSLLIIISFWRLVYA